MARILKADADTFIGYSYIGKKFYVTNKGTITYRTTSQEAYNILHIVAPDTTITVEQVENLKGTAETVPVNDTEEGQPVNYYTWDNTGAYIKTIQFHDYVEYPLTLDAESGKLYIMNTNLIFDLKLQENKGERIAYLIDYYRNYLGLEINANVMTALYDLLYSGYTPSVYNHIIPRDLEVEPDAPLYWDNVFELSNFDESSPATYMCTSNPSNNFTGQEIGKVLWTDVNTNAVHYSLTSGSSVQYIQKGMKFTLAGTSVLINEEVFSNDGTYTVESIDTTNSIITTKEQLKVSFMPDFRQASLVLAEPNVASVNRETNTITFTTTVPDTIIVGDVLTVKGTGYLSNDKTLTADGTYTVASISGSSVITQEIPAVNYTYSSGSYPIAYKEQNLGNIYSIKDSTSDTSKSVITFINNVPNIPVADDKVIIEGYDTPFIVSSATATTITVNKSGSNPTSYNVPYGSLQRRVPEQLISINVLTSNNPDEFPTGEFIVDTFEQCQNYISTLSGLKYPSGTTNTHLNAQVPDTFQVKNASNNTVLTMKCKGLYSEIYSDTNSEIYN